MRCEEMMDLMQRDLDQDLTGEEKTLLRKHCAGCPECAEMYEKLVRLSADLSSLPKVTPPVSIVDRVMVQIDQDLLKEEPDAVRETRRPFLRWGIGTVAAAVILGIGLIRAFDIAPQSQQEIALSNSQAEQSGAASSDGNHASDRAMPGTLDGSSTDSHKPPRDNPEKAGAAIENRIMMEDNTKENRAAQEKAIAPKQGVHNPSASDNKTNQSEPIEPNLSGSPEENRVFSMADQPPANDNMQREEKRQADQSPAAPSSSADSDKSDQSMQSGPSSQQEMALAPPDHSTSQGPMGFMAIPEAPGESGGAQGSPTAAEAVSPSGKYRAAIQLDVKTNQKQLIILDSQGSVIGQSHAWPNGNSERVIWLGDQQVKYTYRAGTSNVIETWHYHLSTQEDIMVQTSPENEGGAKQDG